MSRNKPNPRKEEVVPGPEVVTDPKVSGGAGGSLAAPRINSRLIQKFFPAMIPGPYGRNYHVGDIRPLIADEIQVNSQGWCWNVVGYHQIGTFSTLTLPTGMTEARDLIDRWYPQQVYKVESQTNSNLKVSQDTLIVPSNFRRYMNLYHMIGADCLVWLNLDRLVQYNEGLASMMTYLPRYISRIKKVFRRWIMRPAPRAIIDQTWRDGQILYIPGSTPVLMRYWTFYDYTVSPWSLPTGSTWTLSGYVHDPYSIAASDATMSQATADLEGAILALEGLPAVANDKTDFNNIITLMRECEKIEPGYFGIAGMSETDEKIVPGLIGDWSMLDEYRAGGLVVYDTKGAGTDQLVVFPAYGLSDFDGRLPIKGWGNPADPKYYSLWGRFKAGLMDATTRSYADIATAGVLFGQSMPSANTSWNASTALPAESTYTREDGWISQIRTTTDLGDGASIRTAINTGRNDMKHVWWPAQFAAQLTTNLEYRFINDVVTPVSFWIDQEDLFDNYLTDMSKMLNIPKY